SSERLAAPRRRAHAVYNKSEYLSHKSMKTTTTPNSIFCCMDLRLVTWRHINFDLRLKLKVLFKQNPSRDAVASSYLFYDRLVERRLPLRLCSFYQPGSVQLREIITWVSRILMN